MKAMTEHERRAHTFRDLHEGLLLLPNAWDPLSAYAIATAGASAVATTSAGVAWSRATADGGALGMDLACDAVARLLRVVEVPVSADIERGYAVAPQDAAANLARFIAAGVSGVNIEDFVDGQVVPVSDQVRLLDAASSAREDSGVPVFINARTDVFLKADPSRPPSDLFDEVLERAGEYRSAGADGLFVTGLRDLDVIERLCRSVALPVNVGPVADLDVLGRAGVRRISWGPQLAMRAAAWIGREAAAVLGTADQLPSEGLDLGDFMRAVEEPA
jgi:2-methylisocitrate lyase-like PEP mutase family enzyme